MNKNFMKITVPRYATNNKVISSAVSSFAEQLNPTSSELQDIYLSVNEAIDNCICHAYPENDCGIICVFCKILKNNVISIIVRDYGVGIQDVERAMQPLYTTALEAHCGMGFTIMESYMTECKVSSVPGKGTKVSMKKRVGV